jgi:methyl-accepting chemotaxis protein
MVNRIGTIEEVLMKRLSIMSKLAVTICFSLILIETILGILSVSGRYNEELTGLQTKISNVIGGYAQFMEQFGIPEPLFFERLASENQLIDDIHLIDYQGLRVSGNSIQGLRIPFSNVLVHQENSFKEIISDDQPYLIVTQQFSFSDKNYKILVVKNLNDVSQSSTAFGWRILWITILVIAIVVISILLIAKFTIIAPIHRLVDIVEDIAEGDGDLTARVKITSQDEISELAGGMNAFIQKLQFLVKRVVQNIELLSQNLTELHSSSEFIHQSTKQVTMESQIANEATQESAKQIATVSKIVNETENQMNDIEISLKEIASTNTEIADQSIKAEEITKNAVIVGNKAIDQVNLLNESARKITGISDIIIDISEKTDFLALNAVIESARVGEAGKGFAVVAAEVKNLAKQSNEAITDIRKILSATEKNILNTNKAIQGFSEVTNSLNEFILSVVDGIDVQNKSTAAISIQFNDFFSKMQEINRNMAKGSKATDEVSSKVKSVSLKNDEITKVGTELFQKTNELIEIKNNILQSISVFKL